MISARIEPLRTNPAHSLALTVATVNATGETIHAFTIALGDTDSIRKVIDSMQTQLQEISAKYALEGV